LELYLVIVAGDRPRPVAHILHTAIYRLRALAWARHVTLRPGPWSKNCRSVSLRCQTAPPECPGHDPSVCQPIAFSPLSYGAVPASPRLPMAPLRPDGRTAWCLYINALAAPSAAWPCRWR